MRRSTQRDNIATLLFGLTNKSVEFRNKWRGVALVAIWLLLSGFTMILTIIGVTSQIHAAIIIGMSFLKYIPLLMVVYSLSRKMAARYLEDVYELNDEDLASNFLEEVTFGYGHEKITINEGRIPETDEVSPIILIGGPGLIQVNLDSVALLEKVDGEPEVIYPRNDPWKLGRFERIREIGKNDEVGKREYAIINLRDQFVSGLSVKSRTKDGIPIEAQDIKVLFSLPRRQKSEDDKVQGDAYLFDEKAVRALVYNQTIITPVPSTPSGITFPWDTTVIPLVLTELEKLITSNTLSEILATISQKETDLLANNDQTIAQMRVELTGKQTIGERKESLAPNFKSRSKITAQFFDKSFKEKADKLGVSVEWIDIGTWQLPSELILDKHKEAWNLSRENAKKLAGVERSKKRHEMEEIIKLIDSVIIRNYERPSGMRTSFYKDKDKEKEMEKELEELMAFYKDKDMEKELEDFVAHNPDLKGQLRQRDTSKKDATAIAQEILKAFRKELLAGKSLIENDNRPLSEKQDELAKIGKALFDISHLTHHWIKK